jgi:flagellar basal body-associated protein FliL
MADRMMNQGNKATTAEGENSFDDTPKTISKATMIMLGATILFIIAASILIAVFLNSPTGSEPRNSANTSESRANP